jgi:hypothetical protein
MENLISQFSINPYNFVNLSPQEQAKMVGVDTTKFDSGIKELKSELSIANREKLRLMKLIPPTEEEPKAITVTSPSEIIEQINKVNEHNAKVDQVNRLIDNHRKDRKALVVKQEDYRSEIVRLEELIMDCEKEVISIDMLINTTEEEQAKRGEDKYIEKELLETQLKNIEKDNREADEYKRFIENCKNLDVSKGEYTKIASQIADLGAEKVSYLQSQSFPKEVSIDDEGGLLINGRELDETSFNHAKVMEIILALLKKDNATLKTIFIKDGNLYDSETLARLEAMGYQLLIEVVKNDLPTERVVYIKESKVVKNLEVEPAQQESLFDF